VTDNFTLVVSTGVDFVGFVKSKEQKKKEANDVVVGLHDLVTQEYVSLHLSHFTFRDG
jgi:hypothetical protein